MKALLLDIGNVIVRFDFAEARERLAASSDEPGDPLELLGPLKHQLETGEIAGATFLERAAKTLGYRGSLEELRRTWEDIFAPNEPMWETIRRAAPQYRLLLLSSTSDLHKACLFRDFGIFGVFEGGVYSYECQCLKPDAKIYQTAIDELRLEPSETLYVDDGQANVDAGARAGLASLLYDPDDHEDFLRRARARGFAL